jgi:hypothetical protein
MNFPPARDRANVEVVALQVIIPGKLYLRMQAEGIGDMMILIGGESELEPSTFCERLRKLYGFIPKVTMCVGVT